MKKGLYAMSLTVLMLAMTACGGNASAPAETKAGETSAGTQAAAETAGDEADTQAGETAAETEAAVELKYSVDDFLEGVDYDPFEYVTLPEDYRNLELDVEIKAPEEITEEEIDEEVNDWLMYRSVLIPNDKQTVEDGDAVNVSYVGKVDGKEIEWETRENETIIIGFEENVLEESLIGHSVGDSFSVSIDMPEDSADEEVSGKTVDYDVTINCICDNRIATIDDLDEEMFKYIADFNSVQELRDHCKESLEYTQQQQRFDDVNTAFYNKMKEECGLQITDDLLEEEKKTIEEYNETHPWYDDMDDFVTANGYESLDALAEDALCHEYIEQAILKNELAAMSDKEMADFIDKVEERRNGRDIKLNRLGVNVVMMDIINGYFEKYYPDLPQGQYHRKAVYD